MEKNDYIKQLFHARKLRSDEEYQLFENAFEKLDKTITSDDLNEICKVFCDDTEDDEMMFNLIHLIERLPEDDYLKGIAINSPNMVEGYNWAIILNRRILNNRQSHYKYINIINTLKQFDKTKILELLFDVKKNTPEKFSEKIDEFFTKGEFFE